MWMDVLLIQGAGAGAHDADLALAEGLRQALGEGFRVHFPRMPGEGDPDKVLWTLSIADEARRTNAHILVAHSAGAAITADMLAQGLHRTVLPPLRAVVLLAPPYIGRGGWDFEGYHLDLSARHASLDGLPVHFYFGAEDATVPLSHADLYAKAFPRATIHRLPNCDHQFAGRLVDVAKDLMDLAPARPTRRSERVAFRTGRRSRPAAP